MTMRHLLWKDAMTIKPLMAAIGMAILAIYGLLMIAASWSASDSSRTFVSFWVLMPNLVALGAPALLVGSEEENGTLGWLRTLPVRWQQVADSKFLVALCGLMLTWIVASLVLLIASSVVFPGVALAQSWMAIESASQPSRYVEDMLSFSSVSYLIFFSVLLLLCGFLTAYLFRSPVSGLIGVVPLILAVNWLAIELGEFILTGRFDHPAPIVVKSIAGYIPVVMAGVGLLIAVWCVQRILACRRLTSPQTNRLVNLSTPDSSSAYRPPAVVGTARPSWWTALIWQQRRQMAVPAVVLALMVSAIVALASFDQEGEPFTFARGIAPLVILVGTSWLGGLAFYGDNVRGHRAFFADRGISSTVVWWTRLSIPVILFVLMLAIASAVGHPQRHRGEANFVVMIVSFSVGLMIGQWTQRPVLTFLVGPAAAAVGMACLILMYELYPDHYWSGIFVLPVFLFASWRLTGRWMLGRIDLGYQWRTLAYSAAAIAAPFLAIVVERMATTPDSMPGWRASMFAAETPTGRTYANGRLIHSLDIVPHTFSHSGFAPAYSVASTAEKLELLNQELESDRIGDYVSLDDVDVALGSEDRELQHLGIKVLLKWTRTVRERAIAGNSTLWDLETAAEVSEERAVSALEKLTAREVTPDLAAMVQSIPDQQLRKDSRRTALIVEWKAYQAMGWEMEHLGHKNFAHTPVGVGLSRFPFERTRADRYIDQLTQLLLQQVDELPDVSLVQYSKRRRLWNEAIHQSYFGMTRSLPVGRNWTLQHEERIDRLRALVADHR